jgi:hypothetical protein
MAVTLELWDEHTGDLQEIIQHSSNVFQVEQRLSFSPSPTTDVEGHTLSSRRLRVCGFSGFGSFFDDD